MKCNNCGRELKDDAKFCDGCGTNLENTQVPQTETVNETNGEIETNQENIEQVSIQEEVVTETYQETAPVAVAPVSTTQIDNNYVTSKKSNGKIIAIVIAVVVLLIGIVLAIVLLTSSGNKNSGGDSGSGENVVSDDNGNGNASNPSGNDNNPVANPGETREELAKRLISNISYEMNCNMVQHICLLKVTNNNKENVNAVLSNITLYNKNNEFLGMNTSPLYANGLGPGESGYITIYEHNFKEHKMKEYDHFEAEYYLQDFNFKNHKKDLTYTVTKDDKNKKFVIKVKNNSDSNIDSNRFGMLFYKNNKLVAATAYSETRDLNDKYISYVKPQEEFIVLVNYPFLDGFNGEVVDYDRYEVVIQEAYEYTDARDIRYRESHKRED